VRLDINPLPVAKARKTLWDQILHVPHYRRVFLLYYEAKYKGGEIQLSDEHEYLEWVDIATWNPKEDQFVMEEVSAIQTFLKMKRDEVAR